MQEWLERCVWGLGGDAAKYRNVEESMKQLEVAVEG